MMWKIRYMTTLKKIRKVLGLKLSLSQKSNVFILTTKSTHTVCIF
uniref:Uncharacterized protein n=1 Tax=Rhizophora mucronata TaxID=61149 RepID=A0A2P2N9V6_RHIMU